MPQLHRLRSRLTRGASPQPPDLTRAAPGGGTARTGPHGLGVRDEGGEDQADVPTAGVIAGHLWCDVRHL
jgi:hypothetical protein